MLDEQACLVQGQSDSEISKLGSFASLARAMAYIDGGESGEPISASTINHPNDSINDTNEGGDLIDYNETSMLAQFHEDALKQAGCGIAQIRIILAAGLAIMGFSLELAAIPFILPSAEIELCILPHEKSWLITISLFGLWLGSAGWGLLAERGGRRRSLLSALAVNAVFATIAAFMPTYGTAMMARFCSAIGSGGIIPTVFTYVAEFCPRAHRNKSLVPMVLFMALGGFYAAGVARALVPYTGAETLKEDKQHFSAWHRYLLLCTLPILSALVALIWTEESPRYLLEVGREVDACTIYQNIHSSNQVLPCGKKNNMVNSGSDYHLGELSLPNKRRQHTLHHVKHGVKMFWHSFFQLFSHTYLTSTLTLGGTLTLAMAMQFFLSAYTPTTVVWMENQQFEAAKLIRQNETFDSIVYTQTIENVEYVDSNFNNCTFRDMFLSHVTFKNCTFLDVTFSNIKTSYTTFKGVSIVNSSLLDTDINPRRDMDEWCVLSNTLIRGVNGKCLRRADLTSRLHPVWSEQTHMAGAQLAAAAAALLPHRVRPTVALSAACILLSPAIYFARTETALYSIEAIYRFFITLIFFATTVSIVETYPASLRCMAHGLIMSVAYLGALVAREIGALGPNWVISAVVAAFLSIACTAVSSRLKPTHTFMI